MDRFEALKESCQIMEAALKHLPTNLKLAEQYVHLEREVEVISEVARDLGDKLLAAEMQAVELERGIKSLL
tara:strand:- start:1405 stop:1617 length:213 start_codon:yes stop_codon:yes gene_type:complete